MIEGTRLSSEATDRLAIRELVDAYAHCADRRDAAAQTALFAANAHFVVFMNSKDPTPSIEFHTRADVAPVFEELKKYDATTHFNGQSTVRLEGSRATGETYCLAHHVTLAEGGRRLMVASLRYLDVFAKSEGKWLFAERRLLVDWIEERAMA